jgi:hypothetical protein
MNIRILSELLFMLNRTQKITFGLKGQVFGRKLKNLFVMRID